MTRIKRQLSERERVAQLEQQVAELRATLLARTGWLLRGGPGTPEGVVAAPVGTVYLRTDGGASATIYIKETGTSTAGWRAL